MAPASTGCLTYVQYTEYVTKGQPWVMMQRFARTEGP
jgi:hypothetical protein